MRVFWSLEFCVIFGAGNGSDFMFDLETIVNEQQFSSLLVVFYNKTVPTIKTTIPTIILSDSLVPFYNERGRNQQTITIVFLGTLEVLERISDHFQYALDTQLLIISEKLDPETLFNKCYELDLPNVILYYENSYFSYCFKYPINIFPISINYISKKSWFDKYIDFKCQWELEIMSRRNKLGELADLSIDFSQRLNSIIKLTNPLTMSEEPVIAADKSALNIGRYAETTNMHYLAVVLIQPISSIKIDKYSFFLIPFGKFTWSVILVSIFYIAVILTIFGK